MPPDPTPAAADPWGQPDQSGQPGIQPGAQPAAPYPYGVPPQPGQPPLPGQPDQPPPPAGAPGVPYPYAQPAVPSQPFYGQSGAPYPYGASAAPSQPFYPMPADPSQPFYGQPGMPGTLPPQTWGAMSQTLPGAPPAPPAAPRKSHRKLWIILASVAVMLVLLGGGGAFAFVQYLGPATAAGVFCGDLKAQDYTAAYKQLTAKLQQQFPQDQFVQGAGTLDKIEGTVTSCATSSGSSYNYNLGSSTASVVAVIKRSNAGSLEGVLRLKDESGWKVDGLDTNLLGINLGALAAASSFCSDLQTQNYTSAYGVLGSSQTNAITQQAFAHAGQLHDQIDGNVSSCTLNSIAAGADDTKASLGVTVTRSKLGARQGTVNLEVEDNAWKIDIFDQSLLGSDLGPLAVGTQFCTDLTKGDYTSAYALFSPDFRANVTQADFTSVLTPPSPFIWSKCTPDLATYKVSGSTGSYVSAFVLLDPGSGQSASVDFKLDFIATGSGWAIDDLAKP